MLEIAQSENCVGPPGVAAISVQRSKAITKDATRGENMTWKTLLHKAGHDTTCKRKLRTLLTQPTETPLGVTAGHEGLPNLPGPLLNFSHRKQIKQGHKVIIIKRARLSQTSLGPSLGIRRSKLPRLQKVLSAPSRVGRPLWREPSSTSLGAIDIGVVSEAALLPALVISLHASALLACVLTSMGVECKTQRLIRIILGNATLRQVGMA